MRNLINSYKITIANNDLETFKRCLLELDIPKLYSYVLYYNNKSYEFSCNVSQSDKYNTIDVNKAIVNVVDKVNEPGSKNKIVTYDQPTLDVLVEALKPLVNALAYKQSKRWKNLPYDDLKQQCYCCLCTLYRKGYYIHKAILERTFQNAVYYMLRKEPRDIVTVSFEQTVGDEGLTVADTIRDYEKEYEIEDAELDDAELQVLCAQRDIIIAIIGERNYDQIVREYRNHTVSSATHNKIERLHKRMEKDGFDKNFWMKYFE